MKFTGQIRVPDIDHPGIPATFLIEDAQAEVILEGDESIGRWSLFDVHARRLVASAFQVDLDGEEITFVADEPIDFAYRGVEHMAEVWARLKSMNVARRLIAVPRSRSGTKPSKVADLRAAMEQNLEAESSRGLSGDPRGRVTEGTFTAESVAKEIESLSSTAARSAEDDTAPQIPLVGDRPPTHPRATEPVAPGAVHDDTGDEGEAEHLEAERQAIQEERGRLEDQRRRLEAELAEAAQREANRVEAFRIEMRRLEEERKEFERLESERQTSMREAMERLEAERGEVVRRRAEEAAQLESDEAERAAALSERMKELEEERQRRETEEADRVETARQRMEELEEQQRRIDSLDHEHADTEQDEGGPHPDVGSGSEQTRVVDLGELEEEHDQQPPSDTEPDEGASEPPAEPEPALAAMSEERSGGIMGAVRAAFSRGGREHVHDFVDAPGGLGIARSICKECGYVSISTE